MAHFRKNSNPKAVEVLKRVIKLYPAKDPIRCNLTIAQYKNNVKEAALKNHFVIENKNPFLAAPLFKIIYIEKLVVVEKYNLPFEFMLS